MKPSCLVVLSGGQDSTSCLYYAKKYYKVIHAITFDYGQSHLLEIAAAKKIAAYAGVTSHEVIKVPAILISTSPLLSDTELPQYESKVQMEAIVGNKKEVTFVPMRNGLFLTIAANRAESLGCETIYTGVCAEDDANYPDCTANFIDAAQNYIDESLGHRKIMISAPWLRVSKADQIRTMWDEPGWQEAISMSHTSYDGKFPPTDKNHANILRAASFEEAGLPDPLVVRAWKRGLMELPETKNYERVTNDYPKTV